MTDRTSAPSREIGDDATAEVAERAREELLTEWGTQLPLLVGTAMLLLGPQSRAAGALAAGGMALLILAGTAVWAYGTERGRRDGAEVLLAEYAVLRFVDPGIGRRPVADTIAQGFVFGRFLAWPLWLGAVGLLLSLGQWEQPGWAVPGAVLVAVGAAVHLRSTEREARAGRRWRAAPPGPPRD